MTNNQLLLNRLAELMLEKQQHIIALDDLFEDEQIGAFVRSIQIDSPYQQLIFEGVLTETIKEERVMVTFTVEGYFHYVLGEVIEKQTLDKGAEALKDLLENNQLRGITEGVEQCLVRDVEKNDLSRLMWLIDEGGKALEASAYPLAQAFLIHPTERVMDELLADPSDNDIEVLEKTISNLKRGQKLTVVKKIYNILIKKIKGGNYSQNKLLINSLEYIPKKERIGLLKHLKDKLIKYGDSNLINQLFFHLRLNGESSNCISIINKNKQLKIDNNTLGLLNSDLGNYEKSIHYYQKEISDLNSSAKINQKYLAMLYNNIGSNYLRKNKVNECIDYFKKSIFISEKYFGKYHPSYATSLINLGNALIKKSNFNDTILLNEKVRIIFTNIYGEKHRSMIYIHNNISDSYLGLNKPLKALNYQKKSLEICESYFGINHPEMGTCLNKIGFIYLRLKDFNSAKKYHTKSLDLYEKLLPEKHPFIQIAKETLKHTLKLKLANDQ